MFADTGKSSTAQNCLEAPQNWLCPTATARAPVSTQEGPCQVWLCAQISNGSQVPSLTRLQPTRHQLSEGRTSQWAPLHPDWSMLMLTMVKESRSLGLGAQTLSTLQAMIKFLSRLNDAKIGAERPPHCWGDSVYVSVKALPAGFFAGISSALMVLGNQLCSQF